MSSPFFFSQVAGLRRVNEAAQFVSAGRWSEAYMAYKSAVVELSNALQSEKCSERRHECRQIIAACLNRAEDLYNRYLLRSNTPATRNGAADGIQKAWLLQTYHQTLSSLCQDSRLLECLKPKEYLKELRVCRIEGTQLVVRHLSDRTLEYSLEPLHLTSYHENCSPPPTMTACVVPAISRSNCILPLDVTPFMLQLRNIVETQECIFLLTERARGPQFFDWFQRHTERRFAVEWRNSFLGLATKHDTAMDNAGIRHIAWCRLRSARIRCVLKSVENDCESGVEAGHDATQSHLPDLLFPTKQNDVTICHAKSPSDHLRVVLGTEKVDTTVPAEVVAFERLELFGTVTPSELLQFHPYYPSRMLRTSRLTRGLSLDREKCPLYGGQSQQTASAGTSAFILDSPRWMNLCAQWDKASLSDSWIPLIPERQLRLWAAELVYAVCWLHERGVVLRTLCRSDLYLGGKGRLKLRYFYTWPDNNNLAHRGVHSPSRLDYSLAPELRLGVSMHHLLVEQSQFPSPSSACRMPKEQKRALFACDWWSVGVLLYELFTGLELTETHTTGLFSDVHLDLPPHLPSSLSSLLSSLISFNHTKRPSDEEVKSHPFFKDIDWHTLSDNNH
uniref:Ribosomal protein S6 kinase delta-1 n=1 Tax=Schistocephalus solidus TaxID=70667 RepID=A0A0X3P087_SCHSO